MLQTKVFSQGEFEKLTGEAIIPVGDDRFGVSFDGKMTAVYPRELPLDQNGEPFIPESVVANEEWARKLMIDPLTFAYDIYIWTGSYDKTKGEFTSCTPDKATDLLVSASFTPDVPTPENEAKYFGERLHAQWSHIKPVEKTEEHTYCGECYWVIPAWVLPDSERQRLVAEYNIRCADISLKNELNPLLPAAIGQLMIRDWLPRVNAVEAWHGEVTDEGFVLDAGSKDGPAVYPRTLDGIKDLTERVIQYEAHVGQ